MATISSVKQQYERFPYPPVSALALPRRDQGEGLSYERAVGLAREAGKKPLQRQTHQGIRILVAGAGTLEALVVAQQHPKAREVVALDLSHKSLARLRKRVRWARTRNAIYLAPLWGKRLPHIRYEQGDINQFDEQGFDYILASNMLHHTDDAAATLKHLSGLLCEGGVMRVVTYPAMSRYWIRQTAAWLKWHGLTQQAPDLKQRAKQLIDNLPVDHPIRSCFIAHSETTTVTGIVDAFFHACEKPLSPLEWQDASEEAGLELLGETQSEMSRGTFLDELMPECKKLTPWQKLQILDDTLELSSSPIWWFRKRLAEERAPALGWPLIADDQVACFEPGEAFYLPSETYWQLGQAVKRADKLLSLVETDVEKWINTLSVEVGPRVTANDQELSHLTIGEFDTQQLLTAKKPIKAPILEEQLLQCFGHPITLCFQGEPVAGDTLHEQLAWLQLRYGSLVASIGPLTVC